MQTRSYSTKQSTSAEGENKCLPDAFYLLTLDGFLKFLEVTLNFLCFICILVGGYYFLGIGWPTFVAIGGFAISMIFLLSSVFASDNMQSLAWITMEMVFAFVWSIFHFTAASVLGFAASQQEGSFGWAAASFFSFSAMCVYGLDCYTKFNNWKSEPDSAEV